ncbi:hypothetical protein ACFRMN_37925 [Streptomyces sp. NPDC056835]|uniref:hypothetical protein n=1 Tax=Streptomyces sp. NPDC056835 TaxID=3345956 RepID=UPI003696C930
MNLMRQVRRVLPFGFAGAGLMVSLLDSIRQFAQDGSAHATTNVCVVVALGATIQFYRDLVQSERK